MEANRIIPIITRLSVDKFFNVGSDIFLNKEIL